MATLTAITVPSGLQQEAIEVLEKAGFEFNSTGSGEQTFTKEGKMAVMEQKAVLSKLREIVFPDNIFDEFECEDE